MRNVPRNTHDENYPDPVPVGVCPMCGEPIYAGDECLDTDDGLVHLSDICMTYKQEGGNKRLNVTCALAYVLDTASTFDICDCLGIPRKGWS